MTLVDSEKTHDPANPPSEARWLARPIPLTEQEWPDTNHPVVSICCIAFQHEAFIRKCLDGFLMQETSFPVEVLIHDDASTDETPNIIREYESRYPCIIKPIYQTENQYSKNVKPNKTFNFPRALGTYIAICEGDDYWTDPLKLSKQVAFLENNKDHVLCWTRFHTLDNKTGDISMDKNGKYFTPGCEGVEFSFETFLEGWHIGMPTFMFRENALPPSKYEGRKSYRDVFMISDLLSIGKGYCLNEVTAVYRIHEGGIYSGVEQCARAETGARVYKEIFLAYPNNPYLKEKYRRFNRKYVHWLLRDNNYLEALRAAEQEIALTTPEDEHDAAFKRYVLELLEHNGQQIEGERNQYDDLKSSWSFRAGNFLIKPIKLVARLYETTRSVIDDGRRKMDKSQDKR